MSMQTGILLFAICVCGEPSPNVVVLLADDLGWADLGCYGSTFHESPNLDSLAREGMRFTTAYSAASLCSPTRASIMTGKHPARVKITDWIPGAGDKGRLLQTPEDIHNLPLDEITLGEAFQRAGYETFYAGKWHLGDPEHGPDKQGFDTYIKTVTRTVTRHGKSRTERIAIPDGDRAHLTKYITKQTVRYIESRNSDKPFLAYVAYHDVHTPILPDDRFVGHFKKKAKGLSIKNKPNKPVVEGDGKTRTSQDNPRYASMVRGLDQSVGDILKSLAKKGVDENTIVVFASDNGGLSTLKKPGPACNLPLRAGKGWLYEGGIRIPMIWRYPKRIEPGTVSKLAVTTIDFYPTLLNLCGLPLIQNQHVDAADFSSELLGRSQKIERDLFWHFPHYHGSCWTPGAAIRSGDWKLVRFYETQKHELYNLAVDPYERVEVSGQHADVAKRLSKALEAWQKSVGAQFPVRR